MAVKSFPPLPCCLVWVMTALVVAGPPPVLAADTAGVALQVASADAPAPDDFAQWMEEARQAIARVGAFVERHTGADVAPVPKRAEIPAHVTAAST